jgi:hypothetical protein
VGELFSKKVRKEHEDLREKYDVLEGKYDHLQSEHDHLREEAGEKTNMRISNIEGEIESMNKRVEKLATDSYAIRSEVRDIHTSVKGMQSSLSDIVKLYKAILTQYGFGNVQVDRLKATPAGKLKAGKDTPSPASGEPGDDIIRTLERERSERDEPARPPPPPISRTVPPKHQAHSTPSPSSPPPKSPPLRQPPPQQPPPPPPPPPPPSVAPSSSSALDELHRLSEEQRARESLDGESVAQKLASRAEREDRVTRVAHRDMGRMDVVDRGGEGEFTRSLPKKDLASRRSAQENHGDAWEALGAPPANTGDRETPRRERRKVSLEDLLSPE